MYLLRFFNSVIACQTVHYTRHCLATVTKMIFYPFQSRCILEVASASRKCGYYVISIQQEDDVSICRVSVSDEFSIGGEKYAHYFSRSHFCHDFNNLRYGGGISI